MTERQFNMARLYMWLNWSKHKDSNDKLNHIALAEYVAKLYDIYEEDGKVPIKLYKLAENHNVL